MARTSIVLLFVLGLCAPARADQVVVVDVSYEHSATTTTDSHYRLDPRPETPADLTSPIDYASGSAVVRLEVFTKPSDAATRFQVCFEASPTYACTDQAPAYTTTGIYTWETPFSRFYQGDMVDWSRGLGRVALILKDTMNRKPAPENVGEEVSALYMPTMIRVTVTLVSPGDTYVEPDFLHDAGMPMPDAGTESDAGPPDAGAVADAGSSPDAGALPPFDAGRGGSDAGEPAASPGSGEVTGGCSAAGTSSAPWIALALVALATRRRRRRRRR